MNFLEAVQAMKEGKKVRRRNKEFYLKIDDLENVLFKRSAINISYFEAIDWEIVEEKKTLSDKHRDVLGQHTKVYDYAQEDVKEALKEFIDWAHKNMPSHNHNRGLITDEEMLEKAKELFGERLI